MEQTNISLNQAEEIITRNQGSVTEKFSQDMKSINDKSADINY
jgi:hypothetical protein